MTLRVAAFDLSLLSTGVADSSGTRRIQSKAKGEKRLIEIRDEVLAVACQADIAVLEGYSYGSPNQAHPVGELGGVVRVGLYEAGVPFEVVPPAVVKVYGTGRGNAPKDEMLLAAVRRFGYQGSSHDEADALILYCLTMHALGAPVVQVPATHLRALQSLSWAERLAASL